MGDRRFFTIPVTNVNEGPTDLTLSPATIVGGTPEGRGIVGAASYEARKFGVHSAMPAGRALKLCPQAIVLKPRMSHYSEVSDQIHAILQRYTPLIRILRRQRM